MPTDVYLELEVFSQLDPRWANKHYGGPRASTKSTIGRYGCAISVIAMYANLISGQQKYTPVTVQDILYERGYTSNTNNFINWPILDKFVPEVKFTGRTDLYNHRPANARELEYIDTALGARKPVIIYVDAAPVEGLQQHYVLVTGRDSNGYWIADPFMAAKDNSKPARLVPRYGTKSQSAICGIIYTPV